MLDEVQVGAINSYSNFAYALKPTLFFEFHGTEAWVKEQAEIVKEISDEEGGSDFQWETSEQDRQKLWEARHNAYYASLALRPGSKGWPTDVCVPISRLAECILQTRQDIDECGLLVPLVGHVGGMVTKITKKYDRRNRAMAFFEMDCFGGTVEVIAFSDCFEKYENLIEEDAVIFINGKMADDTNFSDLKVMADKIGFFLSNVGLTP